MKKESLLQIVTGLLAALFFYAASSKLTDFEKSRGEMMNQVFPAQIAEILTWFIPAIELILIPLLLFPSTRKMALWASLFLLSSFTIYIAVVMTGVFGRVPCSCGGILEHMSYGTHLIFNLFFIGLAFIGTAVEKVWITINRWFNYQKGKEFAKKSE
jgi:uncharacterized membrane protein YphA (DoxX/SURF4 family)